MTICRVQYLLWITIALAAVSAMLSGCGQDGPLYLPDDAAPATQTQAPPPQAGPAPAEAPEKDEP
ncbi:MAG TPA: hypothetical protein ENK49_03100 [Gammaproteobacteria bacterium]|nr:hypothetical protein [Gammaproteobacteria bacterium]